MSSLPSCVASALDLSAELRIAATAAPPTRNEIGSTITSTNTMTTTPITSPFLPQVRPCFDLDERADRQFRHRHGGPSRTMVTEGFDVDLVHERVVAHVKEEHRGLR